MSSRRSQSSSTSPKAGSGKSPSHPKTSSHPEEPVQACDDCLRDSTHANPTPNRHEGATLSFCNKSQCSNCRNFQNTTKKHIEPSKLRKSLSAPDKRKEYIESLNHWETLFDATAVGKQIRGVEDKIQLPTWIYSEKTVANKSKRVLPVFWPRSLLTRKRRIHR